MCLSEAKLLNALSQHLIEMHQDVSLSEAKLLNALSQHLIEMH